jgi:hypothetical protein
MVSYGWCAFYMFGFIVLCGGFLSHSCNPRKQNTNHRLYCRLVTPFFLVGPCLRIDCSPRGSMITTKELYQPSPWVVIAYLWYWNLPLLITQIPAYWGRTKLFSLLSLAWCCQTPAAPCYPQVTAWKFIHFQHQRKSSCSIFPRTTPGKLPYFTRLPGPSRRHVAWGHSKIPSRGAVVCH